MRTPVRTRWPRFPLQLVGRRPDGLPPHLWDEVRVWRRASLTVDLLLIAWLLWLAILLFGSNARVASTIGLALLSMFMLTPVTWAMVLFARSRAKRVLSEVHRRGFRVCTNCGYNLHGLGDRGVCPECGEQWILSGLRGEWMRWCA